MHPNLGRLRLPVIGSPMYIISNPRLVIAQCQAGIIGTLPALNARPAAQLDEWLQQIREELAAWDRAHPESPAAPFAVNHVVHHSNVRLEQDLEITSRHKVPIIITSLGARAEVNATVHASGGLVLHDVINNRFARKAVAQGADGLVLVAAGAGGHGGPMSPFALMQEVRAWFSGLVALSGAIATGQGILAAQSLGADLAYIGSAFIASEEAHAEQRYKDMVVASSGEDIVCTSAFTGVQGNYLRPSIIAAGLDPNHLTEAELARTTAKVWKDIWGCGQGIGAINDICPVADIVSRLQAEYLAARQALQLRAAPWASLAHSSGE